MYLYSVNNFSNEKKWKPIETRINYTSNVWRTQRWMNPRDTIFYTIFFSKKRTGDKITHVVVFFIWRGAEGYIFDKCCVFFFIIHPRSLFCFDYNIYIAYIACTNPSFRLPQHTAVCWVRLYIYKINSNNRK